MTIVTIGNFDGVHLGHQELIRRARNQANGRKTIALFFDPHPTAFFVPDKAPRLLTTPQRRAELLRGYGLDLVDARAFDAEFAAQTPEEFVVNVLVRDHAAHAVVVGRDFRFGRDRAGNTEVLSALGTQHGFSVEVVEPVQHAGEVVSSTRVRESVTEGRVAAAADLLGRYHEVQGEVIEGDKRGRTIGFPTANLDVSGIPPADGVYAVVARVLDSNEPQPVYGVANVGVRPTFRAGRSVEAFLFDFDRDIYGQQLRVGWIQRLRGEQRFDGIDALVAQLHRDVRAAKNIAADTARVAWI